MRIRYQYLLKGPLKSRHSKSKYLHVYLYFIEYQDSSNIPFLEIARLTNEDPHAVRALMRSATQNESIADALIELGVEPEDLPLWIKMSKSVKRMRARARKHRNEQAPHTEKVDYNKATSPAIFQGPSYPYERAIAIATSYRPYKITKAENIYPNDSFYVESPLSPVEDAFWRARLEALREERRREEKYNREMRNREERAKRPLSLDEFKTLSEMKKLYRDIQDQRQWDEYTHWKTNFEFKAASDGAAFQKELESALRDYQETMGQVGQTISNMRPLPSATKITPLVLPRTKDPYKELRTVAKEMDQQRILDFKAIAEFMKERKEKKRIRMLERYPALFQQ